MRLSVAFRAGACIAMIASGPGCSIIPGSDGPAGKVEQVTLLVGDNPPCNVELADPERHGRHWYSAATVSLADHPPGEINGELRYDNDKTAEFTSGDLVVWFGSYEYVEIGPEPGARGTKFPDLSCPVTGHPSQWRPPLEGV